MSKPINELIFDRTLNDIKNHTAKGYYNLSDLKRIHNWIIYLNKELLHTITIIYGFKLGGKVTRADLQHIIDLTRVIINSLYENSKKKPPTLPIVTAWDYEKANTIERLLSLANDFLEAPYKDTLYANAFVAGTANSVYEISQGEFESIAVLRDEKTTKTPQTHTVTLISLSGKTKEYSLNQGAFWRIPKYETIFPNDGYIYNWETQSGNFIIDTGMYDIPLKTDTSKLIAR